MRIFLIGFMGCGKTSVGKKLAEKTGYDFYDLDDEIENFTGKSITKIFETDGEQSFREYESKALLNLSKKEKAVIATGGGTPCFADNMKIIKESGISIYLQTSPETLANRLNQIKQTRPLIASKEKKELDLFVSKKLFEREPYYIKADYIIKEKNICADRILNLIGFKY